LSGGFLREERTYKQGQDERNSWGQTHPAQDSADGENSESSVELGVAAAKKEKRRQLMVVGFADGWIIIRLNRTYREWTMRKAFSPVLFPAVVILAILSIVIWPRANSYGDENSTAQPLRK